MAKKKKEGHSLDHTGPVDHADMHDHLKMPGKDKHASAEHHAANKEADMDEGLSPSEENFDRGQHKSEGMGSNACYE